MYQPIKHDQPSDTTARFPGLLELSRSENLCNGNFDLFIRELLVSISNQVGVPRASFWQWHDDDEYIVNLVRYVGGSTEFGVGEKLYKAEYPKFFQSFDQNLIIAADNVRSDMRLRELTFSYLIPNSINSMLVVQVQVNGNLLGVLNLEHSCGTNKWSREDILHASTAASYIAQSHVISSQMDEIEKNRESGKSFEGLFRDGPIPMWVYDSKTLKFLDVNDEAVARYGYSREEFLSMNILEIRPYEQRSKLFSYLQHKDRPKWMKTKWEHMYKDGTIINAEIVSNWTTYRGQKARLVLAINKDQEGDLQRAKELYYKKLSDYAFYASHNLRGPVASILGLMELLELQGYTRDSLYESMDHLKLAVNRLDKVIGQLNSIVDLEEL